MWVDLWSCWNGTFDHYTTLYILSLLIHTVSACVTVKMTSGPQIWDCWCQDLEEAFSRCLGLGLARRPSACVCLISWDFTLHSVHTHSCHTNTHTKFTHTRSYTLHTHISSLHLHKKSKHTVYKTCWNLTTDRSLDWNPGLWCEGKGPKQESVLSVGGECCLTHQSVCVKIGWEQFNKNNSYCKCNNFSASHVYCFNVWQCYFPSIHVVLI